MTHANDRRLMAIAAAGIAVLLAVSGCATPNATSRPPSAAPATPSVPVATALGIKPTSSSGSGPSPSAKLTAPPESPTPTPSLPPADTLPLVNRRPGFGPGSHPGGRRRAARRAPSSCACPS